MKFALTASVETISNIGKRRAFLLRKIGVITIKDLLLNFPIKFLESAQTLELKESLFYVKILKKFVQGKIYFIIAQFKDEIIKLYFFNKKVLTYYRINEMYKIHGVLEKKQGEYIIKQPKIIYDNRKSVPIYSGSVSNTILNKAVNEIIQQLDWNYPVYKELTIKQALFNMHNIKISNDSLTCLKLLEANLFTNLFMLKKTQTKIKLNRKILELLPWQLSNDQHEAIASIADKLEQAQEMRYLVLGEVGAGKSLIAFATALLMIDAGYNVVLLAPTITLANQHANWMMPLLKENSIKAVYLTKEAKLNLREEIKSGKYQFIIATHTVINLEKIEKLGLLIIDEMQKFGVLQRAKLLNNAARRNLLMLSATPIPRSLSIAISKFITQFNIKSSFFKKEIQTSVLHVSKIEQVILALQSLNCKTYWVLPNIEDNANFQGAINRFEQLIKSFENVFLLHGKMSDQEKIEALDNFKKYDNAILVSTTVIEIGIDVPSAKVMIIENAQNFGLSQLHQLRGRIGRDGNKAFCILLYSKMCKKFEYLKAHLDGFTIAQKDLELRGAGTLLDTKQHGFISNTGFYFLTEEDDWIFNITKKNKLPKDLEEFKLLAAADNLVH